MRQTSAKLIFYSAIIAIVAVFAAKLFTPDITFENQAAAPAEEPQARSILDYGDNSLPQPTAGNQAVPDTCYDLEAYQEFSQREAARINARIYAKAELENGDGLEIYTSEDTAQFYIVRINVDNSQDFEACVIAEGNNFGLQP